MEVADKERIKGLVGTYFQVSRAYGWVYRLPACTTGMQALRKSKGLRCNDEKWLKGLGERRCGDHYLRMYAPKSDRIVLTPAEFAYYRKMGGGTYY